MTACFLLQEAALAAPTLPSAAGGLTPIPPMAIAPFINNPSQLQMPLEHTTVQEIHAGTNGKLIIHIQDAHANLSGQQSLAKALDQLMKRYDLRLVLVEGSARDSSLDEIRKLAPLKEWDIIARRFLYEGIISGEEYLNLTTEHPMKIIGVEYRDLYDEAVKAYAAVVDRRKDILHYLYQAKVSLDRLKVRLYPDAIKDYERSKGSGDAIEGGVDFKAGFENLLRLAEQAEYPLDEFEQVRRLRELMAKESAIDFERANQEQAAILQGLNAAGAKEEARAFGEASRRLRFSQVSQFLLIQRLLKTAADRDVAVANFPELQSYMEYLERFTDLKMDGLMAEVELLEDKVYEKLLKSSDARKVRAIDRFLGLLGNAYKLQMSSRDFAMFTFNEKDFKTESWLAFMNRQLVDLGFFESLVPYQPYLEEARADFGRFYQLVGERDLAFVENAKRIMAEQGESAAVLIAGGYHTDHLTQLLREEGTSYIVLTPVVTDTTDHDRYEELLLSHLKEQEKRLASAHAGRQDAGAYKAQNVAATKIPRGIRPLDLGSRLAAAGAFQGPALEILGSRLARDQIASVQAAASRLASRAESMRPSAGPGDPADGLRSASSEPLRDAAPESAGAHRLIGPAAGPFAAEEVPDSGLSAILPQGVRLTGPTPVEDAKGRGIIVLRPEAATSSPAAASASVEEQMERLNELMNEFNTSLRSALAGTFARSSAEVRHVVLSRGLEGSKNLSVITALAQKRPEVRALDQASEAETDSLLAEMRSAPSGIIYNLIGTPDEIKKFHDVLGRDLVGRTVRAPVDVGGKGDEVADLAGAIMIGAVLGPIKAEYVPSAGGQGVDDALAQATAVRDRNVLNSRIRAHLGADRSKAMLFSDLELPDDFGADYLNALKTAALKAFPRIKDLVDQVAMAARMAATAA